MSPDYRALCAELLAELDWQVFTASRNGIVTRPESVKNVVSRANAALATKPQGATDEELQDLWDAQDFERLRALLLTDADKAEAGE
jgi:hypothetical protein